MSSFDVWIIRFEPGETSPAERLQQAFGIDAASARALEQSVPKIVKHAVAAKAAGEMRQALEAIGAVIECRPSRDKQAGSPEEPAVFHPPGEDIVTSGRVSAIDPFDPPTEPGVLRLSVEQPLPPIAAVRKPAPTLKPESERAPRIAASLMATSLAQQRSKFIRQALGAMVAGSAIVAIGWFLGNSVLRGEADWMGIGFDGLGIYFVGVGVFDLVATLRS